MQGPTRAQKRKNKAAAQSSQREQRIAEENASMGESDRAAEQRQLSELLAPLGLCIQDIPVRSLRLPSHVLGMLLTTSQTWSVRAARNRVELSCQRYSRLSRDKLRVMLCTPLSPPKQSHALCQLALPSSSSILAHPHRQSSCWAEPAQRLIDRVLCSSAG